MILITGGVGRKTYPGLEVDCLLIVLQDYNWVQESDPKFSETMKLRKGKKPKLSEKQNAVNDKREPNE